MSDTPETDANDEAWQYNMQYDTFSSLMDDPIPWDEFARKLERKFNEARERAEKLSVACYTWEDNWKILAKDVFKRKENNLGLHRRNVRLKRERDEAREQLALTEKNLEISMQQTKQAVQDRADEHVALIQQRDEAREQRDSLHELHNKNAVRSKELLELCGTLREQRDRLAEALIKCREDSVCEQVRMEKCRYTKAADESQANIDRADKALQSLTHNHHNQPTNQPK